MTMLPETARRYAYLALPYLISLAERSATITYGELGAELNLPAQSLGDPLNYVRDVICSPRGLPPLNIIVVRIYKTQNTTRRPPEEVIEASGMRPGETHQAAFDRLKGEVFVYDGWDDLLSG